MTSHPLGNVFEAMMEKGQDQGPYSQSTPLNSGPVKLTVMSAKF